MELPAPILAAIKWVEQNPSWGAAVLVVTIGLATWMLKRS
jgi:hypothetical protein